MPATERGTQQAEHQEDSQDPEEDPEREESSTPAVPAVAVAVGRHHGDRVAVGGGLARHLGHAVTDARVVDTDPDSGEDRHDDDHAQDPKEATSIHDVMHSCPAARRVGPSNPLMT